MRFKEIGFANYVIYEDGTIINSKTRKVVNPQIASSGYLAVTLKHGNSTKRVYIHRVIAIWFVENPLKLKYVDHINRNKLDNSIDNLKWVTSSQNSKNKEAYKKQKLPPFNELLNLINIKTYKEIAHIYGTTVRAIELALHRKGKKPDRSMNVRCEKNGCSKLTTEAVLEIKSKLNNFVNIKVIAKEYGVHESTIRDIQKNKTWKSLNNLAM